MALIRRFVNGLLIGSLHPTIKHRPLKAIHAPKFMHKQSYQRREDRFVTLFSFWFEPKVAVHWSASDLLRMCKNSVPFCIAVKYLAVVIWNYFFLTDVLWTIMTGSRRSSMAGHGVPRHPVYES